MSNLTISTPEDVIRPKTEEEIDPEILEMLVEQAGYDRATCVKSILSNVYDQVSGMYHVTAHHKLKQRLSERKQLLLSGTMSPAAVMVKTRARSRTVSASPPSTAPF